MNGFNPGAIGIHPSMMDEATFARIFPNAPAGAFPAFQQGQARRRSAGNSQPPLRPQVQSAKPATPKGSTTMPAVAKPQAKATPSTSSTPSVDRRTRRPPLTARQAAAAKSCRTEEDRRRLSDIGMEIRARFGVFVKQRDLVAERHCLNELGLDVRATATEANPAAGGYTVASPLADGVIEIRSQIGLSRRVCNVVPMTENTLSIPKVTGELTVYYPGEVVAITPSDLTLGSLFLEVKKRAVLQYATRELYDDALINFADLFLRGSAYSLAAKEDRELVLGDGTSTFNNEVGLIASLGAGGLVSAAAAHDTFAELDLADWTSAMARLPERFVDARLS